MKTLRKYMGLLLSFILVFSFVNISNAESHSIYLDVGHGGKDSGATTLDEQQLEKVWNLETAIACRKTLEDNGVMVNTSRTDDTFIELPKRSELANNSDSECFISIHYNASTNHKGAYGVVIPNKKEGSTELATDVGKQLENIREDVKIWENTNYYSVLRRTNMPSIIVETCFMDNEEDMKYADTLEERQEIGKYVAYGIMDYLGIEYNIDKASEKDTEVSVQDDIDSTSNNSILDRIKEIRNRCNQPSQREKVDYIKNLLNKK